MFSLEPFGKHDLLSFVSFPALFLYPKSSRHSTSHCQQQATGRREYLDRRAEGRLFQNLSPRSKNIWRQASEFESGKLIQDRNENESFWKNISWTILKTICGYVRCAK